VPSKSMLRAMFLVPYSHHQMYLSSSSFFGFDTTNISATIVPFEKQCASAAAVLTQFKIHLAVLMTSVLTISLHTTTC
jgi:hypothetical protein